VVKVVRAVCGRTVTWTLFCPTTVLWAALTHTQCGLSRCTAHSQPCSRAARNNCSAAGALLMLLLLLNLGLDTATDAVSMRIDVLPSMHHFHCTLITAAGNRVYTVGSFHSTFFMRRHIRTNFGRRAFTVAGSTAWNSLPDYLRDPSLSEDTFRRLLKTYLFALY